MKRAICFIASVASAIYVAAMTILAIYPAGRFEGAGE